jgi:PDZ domain-containing protein
MNNESKDTYSNGGQYEMEVNEGDVSKMENSSKKLPIFKRITKFTSITIAALTLGSLTIFVLQPSGYARESLGPVIDVVINTEIPDLSNVKSDSNQGRYAFTTISVQELTVAEVLVAKLSGNDVVLLNGTRGGGTYDAETQMILSKERAISAAWSLRTGEITSNSVMITSVIAESPAEMAGIRVGDIIEEITDDQGVRLVVTSLDVISSAVIGSKVTFHVSRKKSLSDSLIAINMVPYNGRVGVEVTTVPSQAITGIEISTSKVGGASAGLIFTLAVLDKLTAGDLSGGLKIAGTGTIETNGKVGAVHGVTLKAEAAAAAGSDVFFVPRTNYKQVGIHDDMEIVPVDSVLDALKWLCDQGAVVACRN